jgi:hypothetical protein
VITPIAIGRPSAFSPWHVRTNQLAAVVLEVGGSQSSEALS